MTKLLFRRWYFSLPMLLVTLVLVAIASVTVKPDYSAKGHVQLIPPTGTTAADGEKNPIKNPWFDLGYEALGNATMIDVAKKSVLEKMVADGLSDNVTVTMEQVPLFEIEAVGDSPEQATATVQRVQKNISDAVLERQQTLRVAKSETITALELDDGTEVEVKKSKVMRVMIVAAGLGLLLTAGFTIGIDALIRFRRRRQDDDETPDTGSAVGSAHSDGRSSMPAPSRPSFEATQVVIPARPTSLGANGAGPNGSGANGTGVKKPEQPAGRPGTVTPPGRPSNGTPPVVSPQRTRRSSDSGGTEYRSKQVELEPELENAPVDSTIVLPHSRWKRDEKADKL
jgi:hypothetical protein